jgi:integrase
MGAVYKRGRVWWFQIRGQRAQSSESTLKSVAETKLNQRLAEMRIGQVTATEPSLVTYEDLEGLLLTDLRASQRKSVEDVKRYRLPHLRSFFGGVRAREISYDVVNGYVARRLASAAASTVLYEVKLLKRMFGDNARKGFCSPEEIERIIGHLPEHAKPVVRMLYLTAWRTNEALELTWGRVDFEAQTIRLDAGHTKTGKAREFPFGRLPALAALLREQHKKTMALARKRGRVIPQVFHMDGEALQSFRTAWRNAVKKAGLPGLRPHDLRRSAARNLVRAGVSEGVVMKLCGWTTRHMFDRYNVVDTRDLEEGVERLTTFLAGRGRRSGKAGRQG